MMGTIGEGVRARVAAPLVVAAMLSVFTVGASAQPAPVLRDDASACDIAAELGIDREDCRSLSRGLTIGDPSRDLTAGTTSRGLTIGGPEPVPPAESVPEPEVRAEPAAAPAMATPEPPPAPRRAAFRIVFEFNSTVLTAESRTILDRVGTVLTSPGAERLRFQIIGHTDAAGNDTYNQILSERRARAVREYLVRTFGIRPEKVEALGRGESELLVPDQPLASENRRVEIVNLGT